MSVRPTAVLLLLGSLSLPAAAADDAWLHVRVTRPGRLLQHDMVKAVEEALVESPDYLDRLRTPEMQRLIEGRDLLESILDLDWRTGLDKVARNVELRSFDLKNPRDAVLIVESTDRALIAKLLAAAAERNAALKPLAADAAGPGNGEPTVHELGEVFVAIDGPRVIVSPMEARVRSAIGRTLFNAKVGDGPVLQATVDVDSLRQLPMFAKGLELPARDAGIITTAGGWIDHLRRGRKIDVQLTTTDNRLALRAKLESDAPTPDDIRVHGFFAPKNEPVVAPLVGPRTLLALSTHLDLARMWRDRNELLPANVVQRMEERDAEVKMESAVFGLQHTPSEIVGMLGPQYHVVISRAGKLGYDVELDERLPEGVFAVSLRDQEGFRQALEPVFKFFSLILAGQQGLLITNEDFRDTTITTVRFRDDEASRKTGNMIRYHFSPSWVIGDGYFAIGTTRNAVEGLLDALENAKPATVGTTSSSVIPLTNLADAVDDAASLLINRAQLDQGVTSRRAEAELDTFRAILRTLGTARTRTVATDDTVEVVIEVGTD